MLMEAHMQPATIKPRAKELIRSGHSNPSAAEVICREFPGAQTTADCIAFYRSKMRAAGETVLSSWDARRSEKSQLPA